MPEPGGGLVLVGLPGSGKTTVGRLVARRRPVAGIHARQGRLGHGLSPQDLTAVIALQALPCGQVVSAVRQGENDYIASCQDGNRYRVFVNSEGRVVALKQ